MILEPPTTIATRQFRGRRDDGAEVRATLSPESQAALAQFPTDRLTAYGLASADAIELRAAVLAGVNWRQAADDLANTALDLACAAASPAAAASRILYLRRASALLRMSQVMMAADTTERRVIFAQATAAYAKAADISADREHVLIETEAGPLAGWLHPAPQDAAGSAIVIGGVEGWSMDFDTVGAALAARGIDALMLDGPGQGETRFEHRHYLGTRWADAYRGAVDYLARRAPAHRIGIIGNSMGGSLALVVAATDPRISACCSNCGVARPVPGHGKEGLFAKMMAACDVSDEAGVLAIWDTINPAAAGHGIDYPLLIVHGGADPFLPVSAATALLESAPTRDKQMVVFSDGDHCVYNHRDDRDALMADWVRGRLAP